MPVWPSDANPTGITPFDHSRMCHVPEYAAACKALDDLAHALTRAEAGIGQRVFLDAVKEMASAIAFMDNCPTCPQGGAYPHVVEIRDGSITADYRCPAGHNWDCVWSVDAPNWFVTP